MTSWTRYYPEIDGTARPQFRRPNIYCQSHISVRVLESRFHQGNNGEYNIFISLLGQRWKRARALKQFLIMWTFLSLFKCMQRELVSFLFLHRLLKYIQITCFYDYIQSLELLNQYQVGFIWISGHHGIEAIEKSNEYAVVGSFLDKFRACNEVITSWVVVPSICLGTQDIYNQMVCNRHLLNIKDLVVF